LAGFAVGRRCGDNFKLVLGNSGKGQKKKRDKRENFYGTQVFPQAKRKTIVHQNENVRPVPSTS